MKRATWLIPYSHDHQHALAQSLRLRRAADSGDPAQLARHVAEALAFLRDELEPHMRREEDELLPLLASEGLVRAADVDRVAADHARIRVLCTQLSAQPDDASTARLLAATLHDHVRWEERELFERAQRSTTDFQQP